jgi:prepilin-type N-terminal cleavage/methylation domain-containing protein
MLHTYKTKRDEGFTIIEVLIVLAIAGLIMLIVFLAVPALQRNSRNTQRTNDASLIGGSVGECMANKNGQKTACDELADLEAVGLDVTKVTQLTDIEVTGGDPSMPGAGELNHARVGYDTKCTAAGDDVEDGTDRQVVVLFRIEVQGNSDGAPRCVEV